MKSIATFRLTKVMGFIPGLLGAYGLPFIEKWRTRKEQPEEPLPHLRQQIDALDTEIIQLFAHRMQVAERIGRYKKAQKMSAFQPQRWAEVKANRLEKGLALGLSEDFVGNLLDLLHEESLKRQTQIKLENEI
ncbi:MAG: chorismate mutase [Microscillaceae bacterium]|nr:chorismate mutase [Microscillaceae bacterium]